MRECTDSLKDYWSQLTWQALKGYFKKIILSHLSDNTDWVTLDWKMQIIVLYSLDKKHIFPRRERSYSASLFSLNACTF